MSRSAPQLNIRSSFARERATQLALRTGMTTTQVVEAALRAYAPEPPVNVEDSLPPAPAGFIRKGLILVKLGGGRTVTLDELNAQEEADRNERGLVYD